MQSDVISFVQRVLEQNRINVRLCRIEESSDFFPFDYGLRESHTDWMLKSETCCSSFRKMHEISSKEEVIPQEPDVFFFAGPTVQGDAWKSYYQNIK